MSGVKETDPNGRDAHQAGAKLDAGKVRPSLVLGGFARALAAVSEVATYGARKYTDEGWAQVPDGIARYVDAKDRHRLAGCWEECDPESGLMHLAHEAWNALAVLELEMRNQESIRINGKPTPLGTPPYGMFCPQPDADGWIDWKGGECPVPAGVRIDFLSVGEIEVFGVSSDILNWNCGIIRKYRIHKPAEPEEGALVGGSMDYGSADPIPSNSTELDPHAELRKTWAPGQLWEFMAGGTGGWERIRVEPGWFPEYQYRRHPDDEQKWPFYSAGPDHSAAKALWEDGMDWRTRQNAGPWSCWSSELDTTSTPNWLGSDNYEIRPKP